MSGEAPAPAGMDPRQFKAITTAMGELVGSTNGQVMALFIATWTALGDKEPFDEATIRKILGLAGDMVKETRVQDIISDLRQRLFPPH